MHSSWYLWWQGPYSNLHSASKDYSSGIKQMAQSPLIIKKVTIFSLSYKVIDSKDSIDKVGGKIDAGKILLGPNLL